MDFHDEALQTRPFLGRITRLQSKCCHKVCMFSLPWGVWPSSQTLLPTKFFGCPNSARIARVNVAVFAIVPRIH
jgi:hypothetical protein